MVIRHFIAIALALAATAVFAQPSTSAPSSIINIDRVIAVINDEAVTQYELDEAKRVIVQQMKQQNVQPPEADVLDKQILERIIVQRALAQTGKETGVKVDDAQVERAIQRIAQENKMSADEFRQLLVKENIPYGKYRDDIRAEMVVQRMREREVESKITVTDAEVDQYLALAKAQSGGEAEYQLAHILVLVPEQATTEQIETRRRRAEDAMRDLRSGADFGKIAASYSDATDALQGGSLGWRSGARLPTVFADTVRTMKVGAISGVLRSATGFHIVKLLDRRANNEATIVEQTHARHILVRVNERSSEAESKAKIERIKDRLDTGAKFEDMAKLNSEDPSASRGGDLGWLNPSNTIPEFDDVMNKLPLNTVSAPVRTPFGWHLIEVLGRRKQDVTSDRERTEAQNAIRQRKSDEAFQDWVRQVRDRAFVEIRLDDK